MCRRLFLYSWFHSLSLLLFLLLRNSTTFIYAIILYSFNVEFLSSFLHFYDSFNSYRCWFPSKLYNRVLLSPLTVVFLYLFFTRSKRLIFSLIFSLIFFDIESFYIYLFFVCRVCIYIYVNFSHARWLYCVYLEISNSKQCITICHLRRYENNKETKRIFNI